MFGGGYGSRSGSGGCAAGTPPPVLGVARAWLGPPWICVGGSAGRTEEGTGRRGRGSHSSSSAGNYLVALALAFVARATRSRRRRSAPCREHTEKAGSGLLVTGPFVSVGHPTAFAPERKASFVLGTQGALRKDSEGVCTAVCKPSFERAGAPVSRTPRGWQKACGSVHSAGQQRVDYIVLGLQLEGSRGTDFGGASASDPRIVLPPPLRRIDI